MTAAAIGKVQARAPMSLSTGESAAQQRLQTRRARDVQDCRPDVPRSRLRRHLGQRRRARARHDEGRPLPPLRQQGSAAVRDHDVRAGAGTGRGDRPGARACAIPEERLRQLVVRHARIATRGQGAVAQLGRRDSARCRRRARKQIEQRMRVYFDLIRDTLVELKTAGRLRDVDPTVATFSLLGMILWLPRWFRQGGRSRSGSGGEGDRELRARRPADAGTPAGGEAHRVRGDASDAAALTRSIRLSQICQIPPRHRYLISRNSSSPYFDPSRPRPDSFTPPNGATSVEMMPVLMPTIPYSSASATRQIRPMSRP